MEKNKKITFSFISKFKFKISIKNLNSKLEFKILIKNLDSIFIFKTQIQNLDRHLNTQFKFKIFI